MAKNLVIVESPSKCKSIQNYLGEGWKVLASFGHVRTLIPKNGSVDPNDNFNMKFETIKKQYKTKDPIKEIITEAKKADTIWLASDPDREGEAIAYHVKFLLNENGIDKPTHRITFNEITKSAVLDAIKNPRNISMSLVDAQKARQSLDYLVGYNLSPLLWKKVGPSTSAGRVQSPALDLIDKRDAEIKEFKSEEYWSVYLLSHDDKINFKAKLFSYDDIQIKQYDIPNETKANELKNKMSGKEVIVVSASNKTTKRKPQPPFTTSTLQQEGIRKLGFSSSKVMKVAQTLYETIPLFGKGLITYMRTDSVALSNDAIVMIRDYLQKSYDPSYMPPAPIHYVSKSKNAQEAHEAIRPVDISITPDALKEKVDDDLYKLYKLIWTRTLASQMECAKYDTTTYTFKVYKGLFRVTGNVLLFSGFLSVYEDDESDNKEKEEDNQLPKLNIDQHLPNDDIALEQHFTKPPAKYNEASLVKTLEEYGIGRPSTYATIISTLKDRGYVDVENKKFNTSDKGHLVNKYLQDNFKQYIDYGFTANMEDKLDEIANGKLDRKSVLHDFWSEFYPAVEEQKKADIGGRGVLEQLDEICPDCKENHLVVKLSKYGKFIACEGYPKCKYFRKIEQDKPVAEVIENKKCPECGSSLVKRKNRKGQYFIACSAFPECKYIEGRKPVKDTGRLCPKCKKNNLVERTTKFGTMVACSGYPKCKFIENNKSKKTSQKRTNENDQSNTVNNVDGIPY